MRMISLMPVGRVDAALLETLAQGLTSHLRVACSIQPTGLDAEFAFNSQRRQYLSTEILKRIAHISRGNDGKLLGVTELDLYIPVLTYVFGEAQLKDGGAVVSAHRLCQEFYGMPANSDLLHERLLKESLHELGHTYGLHHCPDYTCVMSSSNGVERIDLKSAAFCEACAQPLGADGM
jgi:archaemetzincin